MKYAIILAFIIFGTASCSNRGNEDKTGDVKVNLLVAAAANTQYVMAEVIEEFEKIEGVKVNLVIASSGKLASQIVNGAPYDIFLSANMKFPSYVHDKGFAQKTPSVYALGALVLWSNTDTDLSLGVEILRSEALNKIAIANDKNAPYGTATKQVLERLNLLEDIKYKLVYGESISQVNQFVKTKAVDIGFTSKSVVMSKMKGVGSWADIDPSLYEPIEQGVVITKRGQQAHPALCERFIQHLLSPSTQSLFAKYGYLTGK